MRPMFFRRNKFDGVFFRLFITLTNYKILNERELPIATKWKQRHEKNGRRVCNTVQL